MYIQEHNDYVSRVIFWRQWYWATGEFHYEPAPEEATCAS